MKSVIKTYRTNPILMIIFVIAYILFISWQIGNAWRSIKSTMFITIAITFFAGCGVLLLILAFQRKIILFEDEIELIGARYKLGNFRGFTEEDEIIMQENGETTIIAIKWEEYGKNAKEEIKNYLEKKRNYI